MKYLRVFILLFVFLLPFPAAARVLFTEIAWMGTSASQFSEWIELYNDSNEAVDLSGAGIYKAGGSTLLFLLSKTIEPKSYLLVERITASAPDAVAGVNDESGSFLASGLSNSGEHLVLKDSQGSALDFIDATSGWPAGDNSSKLTMQLVGNTWVTATATPKAATPQFVENRTVAQQTATSTSFSSEIAVLSSHSASTPASVATIAADFSASIGRERLAAVGSVVEFEARTSGSFAGTLSYNWSFGDGGQSNQKNPKHVYAYPGDYVVFVRVGAGETYAVARTVVHVVPAEIAFSVHENGRLDITNNSPYEINIGEWKVDAGTSQFVFPKDTIILGKKKISVPKQVASFTVYASSTPHLVSSNDIISIRGIVRGENEASQISTMELTARTIELADRVPALLALLESTKSALHALSLK